MVYGYVILMRGKHPETGLRLSECCVRLERVSSIMYAEYTFANSEKRMSALGIEPRLLAVAASAQIIMLLSLIRGHCLSLKDSILSV